MVAYKHWSQRQLLKSLVSNQGYENSDCLQHSQKNAAFAESNGGVTKGSPEMFRGMKRLDLKLFDENFLTAGSTVRGIPSDRWESPGAAQVLEFNDPCKGKSLSSSVGSIAGKDTRKKQHQIKAGILVDIARKISK